MNLRRSLIIVTKNFKKWIEIEKNYTIRNGEDFVTYFEKFKLVEIREKMSRYATKEIEDKGARTKSY